MPYSTPELVLLGLAPALVQGGEDGQLDHGDPDVDTRPIMGVALGLDE